MKILIRAAQIVDSQSPLNGQILDLLIENGLIRQIGTDIEADEATQIIAANPASNGSDKGTLCVSAGWVDMRVSAKDPGYEHKEELATACKAAARGGFTDIALLPNTKPTLDSKDTIGYIRHTVLGQPVSVHPIGAITKGAAGVDFTEMIDLHHAGAIAFSDGEHPLSNPDLLVKTLQYLQPFNGLLMNRAEEGGLTVFGQMNEGISSTLLGLKGLPAVAEELIVERDLRLLEYVNSTASVDQTELTTPVLHFSTISTARSVNLIREAKAKGLRVSCDIAAHQLAFDDSALMDFDTNLKVNPPFRLPDDVEALKQGLLDGTIDAIVSDHNPQDEESKNLEFDQAEFGIIGLETVFSVIRTHYPELPLGTLIDKLTYLPRRILRLPEMTIAESQPAVLTVFNPDQTWEYNKTVSKSKNSPFLGATLRGKALWTINKGLAEHVEA
ncbi:dihydroorotase [Tellurirhabdus bombi]|uniref:dihydroorotase n=1 Tax=Tellurirhabdus bombi TaxID=2907205 RepID=UPI001F21200F|nr:dihydroorotase [Tellurirhabdus bombi]